MVLIYILKVEMHDNNLWLTLLVNVGLFDVKYNIPETFLMLMVLNFIKSVASICAASVPFSPHCCRTTDSQHLQPEIRVDWAQIRLCSIIKL